MMMSKRRKLIPWLVIEVAVSLFLVLLTISVNAKDSVYEMEVGDGLYLVDDGQYAHLADAFISGKVRLDLPTPEWLKAMDNPYDSTARGLLGAETGEPSYWDYAYYKGSYYSYFGPLPALILFVPYRVISGTNMETPLAIGILNVLAVLGLTRLSRTICRCYAEKTPNWLQILVTFGILMASSLTYHAVVPRTYSVPILASLALASFGVSMWLEANEPENLRSGRLIAGSVCVGLTLSCRPSFILSSLLAIVIFWRRITRERALFSMRSSWLTVASLAPFFIVGFVMMYYNFIRFGNPFDFGANYNLTGFDMTNRNITFNTMIKTALLYLFLPVCLTRYFPYTYEASAAFSPYANFIVEASIISEPYEGGLAPLTPGTIMILPALLWRKRKMNHEYALKLGISMILLGIVVCLIVSRVALTYRYFGDFAWLVLFGLESITLSWLTTLKRVRTISEVLLAVLVVIGISLQLVLLMTNARYTAWSATNPSLYLFLTKMFSK